MLRLRNRLLPLVSLTELLALGVEDKPESAAHVVVAQVGQHMMGIIVDRVFDTEEIVVKPVAPILRHVTMFSGNTILGDGSVIMILDPNGIARASGVGAGSESKLLRSGAAETPSLLRQDRDAAVPRRRTTNAWAFRSDWSHGWKTSRAKKSRCPAARRSRSTAAS